MGIVVYGIEIAATETRGIVTLGFEVVSINKFNVSFALDFLAMALCLNIICIKYNL
jgi:hypothetical protein